MRKIPFFAAAVICLMLLMAVFSRASGATFSGTVKDTAGKVVPKAFLLLMSAKFQMKDYAATGTDGAFSLKKAEKGDYVAIQPPTETTPEGYGMFRLQPRTFRLGGESSAALTLPAAGCFLLRGYDAAGKLMRVEDFKKNGAIGPIYCYTTDLNDQLRPATLWWVHDKQSSGFGAKPEKGLPALASEPDTGRAIQVMFWEVPGYGKLSLKADNAGKGFAIAKPGEVVAIEVNVELARTAVADLVRRKDCFAAGAQADTDALYARLAQAVKAADEPKRAAAADVVLAAALKLRDKCEVDAAVAAIPKVRKGRIEITVTGADGKPAAHCKVHLAQRSHDFRFGIFEGGPYNHPACEQARQSGFEMISLLLGWNWTEPKDGNWKPVNELFGIDDLKKLGYQIKAHGVIYSQAYGITPDRAMKMDKADLPTAILDHQRQLIETYKNDVALWEVMNEPGCTNVLGLPKSDILSVIKSAAKNIKAITGKPTLINSSHEIDFGRKYLAFNTNGAPADDFDQTYSDFLDTAKAAGALDDVDIIGLQFYPGFHLSAMFGGFEGPAFTPSWLVDTFDRYSRFGKKIHISEFSIPSSYEAKWTCGYWHERWNEQTQADYVEAVYTLAFGNPNVYSVTWWDFSALKPAVVTGSLVDANGKPKPALERIMKLMKEWTTETDAETDASGVAALEGFGGEYDAVITSPAGKKVTKSVHITERDMGKVTVGLQGGK